MGPHIWLDPNGSQLLLVIIHTARARDATATATGAQRLTHWGSHFGAKERILCDSCTTLSHMGGTALGWRGEIGRGILERAECYLLHRLHSELKASSKILSIKLATYSFKLHLNENEDHYGSSETRKLDVASSLSFSLFHPLCFPTPPLSSFLFSLSSPSVGIYMSMTFA